MAETKCAQWGGRLFQPRSTVAMAYFVQAEPNHMTEDLFKFSQPPKSSSILAIGLLYQQLAGDTQPYLYYRCINLSLDQFCETLFFAISTLQLKLLKSN